MSKQSELAPRSHSFHTGPCFLFPSYLGCWSQWKGRNIETTSRLALNNNFLQAISRSLREAFLGLVFEESVLTCFDCLKNLPDLPETFWRLTRNRAPKGWWKPVVSCGFSLETRPSETCGFQEGFSPDKAWISGWGEAHGGNMAR